MTTQVPPPRPEAAHEWVKTLLEQRRDMNALIATAVKQAYPIGSTVEYSHGKNLIRAKVVGHMTSDNVWLEGSTGTRYRMAASRIIAVYPDDQHGG